ncbi:MAG: SLC13 family permease [Waddliaceae bacterium]
MNDQVTLTLVLCLTLFLFIWGKWRYDLVALMSLMACVLLGLIPANEAFLGFGHPVVVTVAAILVIGSGLVSSGLINTLARSLENLGDNPYLQLAGFTILVTLISGFVNNIGAIAVLLPIAMQTCKKKNISPSLLLMPLAFGSLLGGMMTLIGTPPNVIIAGFRRDITGDPFKMFDFMPVGLGVTLAGLAFIILIGFRLIPLRREKGATDEMFEIATYTTEVKVIKNSTVEGMTLEEFNNFSDGEISILGIIRRGKNQTTKSKSFILKSSDLLVIEANTEALETLIQKGGLELVTDKELEKPTTDAEIITMETVITSTSSISGKIASRLFLWNRFGVNLLAIARQGKRLYGRFNNISLRVGDVLLLRGNESDLTTVLGELELLPLADRGIQLKPRRLILASLLFAFAIGVNILNLLPVEIAFALTALAMILTRLVSLKKAYESIDWPIVILLGALIPVGNAFETTGSAETFANSLIYYKHMLPDFMLLGAILVFTMLLSNVINNGAAAILMAPIAVNVALGINASIDPFLMSVAIGASCAFLTPIGHQSNALVMGAGGYHFGDYWRLGLPLGVLTTVVAIPLLMHFWPLYP